MTKNINKFLESTGFKEKGIIQAYLQRETRYMTAQRDIIRCITVKEDGKGKYSPAFSDAVSEHLEEFKSAQDAVAMARADIEAILEALGEFASLGELADARSRARLQVESAERAVKIAISKASITAGEAAMESEPVIKASIHRDEVKAKMGQVLQELEGRLQKAVAILERY